jgi:hypothetical protein
MGTEIIGGLIIGFFAKDWLGRIILPCAVGIIACVQLFFALRKNPLASRHRKAMRTEGMSENEIAEVEQTCKQISGRPLAASGIAGWKLYAWQFTWSSLTALPFSLIAGAIRVFLIDR